MTCIERIFFGVLRSQVIKTLMAMEETSRDLNISLVSFIPIHHYIKYRDIRQQLKTEFRNLGMQFIPIPILFLSRDINIRSWLLPLFLVQTLPVMFAVALFNHAAIIHARSYPASLVGLFIKKLLGVKLIFDMRGLYVDEALLVNKFKPNSSDEKLWRKLEAWLVLKSDAVIGVSPGFRTHLGGLLNDTRFFVVPCSVDLAEFYFDANKRLMRRKELNLAKRFIAVFSGSLGSWVSVQSIITTFKKIQVVKKNAFLLILTQTTDPGIKERLLPLGSKNFAIFNLKPEQVADMLRIADIALLLRKKNVVNEVALAVKFGEYLASGIPVVATKSAREVARLVEEHGCGVVLEDENDPNLEDKIKELIRCKEIYRTNGLRLVKEYLSLQLCSSKFIDIYDKLLL
ncbi:MAG: glycosyltransferase [bacterium]